MGEIVLQMRLQNDEDPSLLIGHICLAKFKPGNCTALNAEQNILKEFPLKLIIFFLPALLDDY